MIRYIGTLLLLLIAPIAWGADNATQILTQAAEQFRKAPSIKAAYTLTASNGSATNGSAIFAGEKFQLVSPQMLVWYDGATQWTLIPNDGEVTITEPTAEELQQVNPFVIINAFRNAYTAKLIKSTATTKKISLTAKNKKATITSATVTINQANRLPTEIGLRLSNGQNITIRISGVSIGKALPATTFRFNAKQYPKVAIIDLR